MTIGAMTSFEELAFIVCTALSRANQLAVLTGGAAAQFYAPSEYRSSDLDFVLSFIGSDQESRAVLEGLGFHRRGRNMVHPICPYTVEFPAGPLAVGDEIIDAWDTVERGGLLLHIINPTDSVRDRLAAFLHWNDRASLETALAVARAQRDRIDLGLVGSWCKKEGVEERKFAEFSRRLGSNPGSLKPTSQTKTSVYFNSRA